MPWRPRFAALPTALLLSIAALPISVIAFAALYENHDSFWAVVWFFALLPAIWLSAAVLCIIDAVRRRSWRQSAAVFTLLAPTALLVYTMNGPRFWEHQLFSFRPLAAISLPSSGVVFVDKFTVCPQGAVCTAVRAAMNTRTFKLGRFSEGCCLLRVQNGRSGRHEVKAFRIVLNGKQVRLPSGDPRIALVVLNAENQLTVQIDGDPDAYIYVIVWATGKKGAPSA